MRQKIDQVSSLDIRKLGHTSKDLITDKTTVVFRSVVFCCDTRKICNKFVL